MLVCCMYFIPGINLQLRNNVFLIYWEKIKDRAWGKEGFWTWSDLVLTSISVIWSDHKGITPVHLKKTNKLYRTYVWDVEVHVYTFLYNPLQLPPTSIILVQAHSTKCNVKGWMGGWVDVKASIESHAHTQVAVSSLQGVTCSSQAVSRALMVHYRRYWEVMVMDLGSMPHGPLLSAVQCSCVVSQH